MIPQAYREAHNSLDLSLSNLRGLSHALWRVTFESSAVDADTPDGIAITVLISMIETEIKKAEAIKETAWAAIHEAHQLEGQA